MVIISKKKNKKEYW